MNATNENHAWPCDLGNANRDWALHDGGSLT
jgi:hypothetical protein